MNPRARAGTERTKAIRPMSSVLLSPRTTTDLSGPARPRVHIPFIRCPECRFREPAGFRGNVTREIVRSADWHFADERGYLYCRGCFIVWNSLPVEHPAPADRHEFVETNPYTHLGATPTWSPQGHGARWRRLYETERAVRASFNIAAPGHEALRRANDRIRDASAVCSALAVPADITVAVTHHLIEVSRKSAKFTSLAGGPRLREEAFILATVALVLERRGGSATYAALASTMRFRDGSVVTPEEFERAKTALRAWYEEHVWRNA